MDVMSAKGASDVSSFINATMSMADDGDSLQLTGQRGIPEDILKAEDRVVPLLVRETVQQTQARQRLHLRLFTDNIDDFICYDDTTDEEWEMLLVMLFAFMRRRGGMTPMQKRYNDEVSDISFGLICHLLLESHEKYSDVLAALMRLMDRLDCTFDKFFQRGSNVPEPSDELLALPDDYETEEEVTKAISEASEVIASPSGAIADATMQGTVKKFLAQPWFYTVDSVPPEDRVGFSETDFRSARDWFNALEPDPADPNVRMVLRGMNSNPTIGMKFCNEGVKSEFQANYPTGGCSFFELIRFLFRFVPERVLIRRCNGVALDSSTTSESQPPEDAMLVDPTPVEIGDRLLLYQRTAGTALTDDVALMLKEWWGYIAFHVERGQLAQYVTSETILAANNGKLGEWTVNAENIVAGKGGHDHITFVDVLKNLFPTVPSTQLRTVAQRANDANREIIASQLEYKANDNAAFEEYLKQIAREAAAAAAAATTSHRLSVGKKASLAGSMSMSRSPSSPAAPPPGAQTKTAVDSALTEEQAKVLDAMFTALQSEHSVRTEAILKKAVLVSAERRAEAHAKAVAKAQDEYHNRMAQMNIPKVFGPAAGPTVEELFGFRVSPALFYLDSFLQRGNRHKVMSLLTRLDRSGVVTGYFLKKQEQLHLYVPQPITQSCKVYRDICICPERPRTGTFWQGDHVLHIVTNIPRHSDIRYRFSIEGYNFGTNAPIYTVVVGYAARMLDSVDQLESYGWPDHWDKNTCVHLGKGIKALKQYFTRNGTVAFRCEAKSFQYVGFSVSASLLHHDFGAGFPVNAAVFHQDEPL